MDSFVRQSRSARGSGKNQRPTRRVISKPMDIAKMDARSTLLPAVRKLHSKRAATQSKK